MILNSKDNFHYKNEGCNINKLTPFQKWLNHYLLTGANRDIRGFGYPIVEESWNACKNEILDIIKDQVVSTFQDEELFYNHIDKDDLIERINKL